MPDAWRCPRPAVPAPPRAAGPSADGGLRDTLAGRCGHQAPHPRLAWCPAIHWADATSGGAKGYFRNPALLPPLTSANNTQDSPGNPAVALPRTSGTACGRGGPIRPEANSRCDVLLPLPGLICSASSVGVPWRPLLAALVVPHLVTRLPVRAARQDREQYTARQGSPWRCMTSCGPQNIASRCRSLLRNPLAT